MFNTHPAGTIEFKEGNNLMVLADGMYPCTRGVFIRLSKDVNWAEVRERNGEVRCHPVVWLRHTDPPGKTVS